jgi:hypothetical protein
MEPPVDHAHVKAAAAATAAAGRRRGDPARPAAVEAIYAVAHWLLSRERTVDAAKVFRVMLRAAPRDERGWLGLGLCHERIDQLRIAAELYGAGSVIAGGACSVSVRCLVARARVFSSIGRDAEIDSILTVAEHAAVAANDEELVALVAGERARMS